MSDAPTLEFPKSLTEKYIPKRVDDFVGMDGMKIVMRNFLANPYPSAWLFVGPSGTGKTSLALAMAEAIPAELRHVASRDCNQQTVEDVAYHCHFFPWDGKKMHLVLVDEANEMTPPAQDAWLSKLDATAFPPNTVIVFTTNTTYRLEERFQSRCRKLQFEEQQPIADVAAFLEKVWNAEHGVGASYSNVNNNPDFDAIAKEVNGNIRSALMKLELALLGLPCPQRAEQPAAEVKPHANSCRDCGKEIPARWTVCNPCLDIRSATSRINKVRAHRKSIVVKGARS